MAKALLIIAQRNFNDDELFITNSILEKKVQVTVASTSSSEATSMKGIKVVPDRTVREALNDSYEAIIIIGGSGSPVLADYPEVIEIIRKQNEKGRIIAAICLGPIILAKAGILEKAMVTVYPSDWALSILNSNGAQYYGEHVVEDGNIITADGPESARAFAELILKKLKE